MTRVRTAFISGTLLALCSTSLFAQRATESNNAPVSQQVAIDAHAAGKPFPHYWEQMFGSGRANLSLRESYRDDLRATKKITGFQYVRFHAIFHDENGVYSEDAQGNPVYNWSYVDQIYDGLLANGVRPFVEIGFMPKALASELNYHAFWYKQITSPPASYAKWDALIGAFAQHLIDRYGIDEVSLWYFEVWNEPNIDFWTGHPAQPTYFELYDHTARALKAVSSRIRVGGPATAQAAWVGDIIAHTGKDRVPLDFVSTHVYANDTADNVFHDNRTIAPRGMVCPAIEKVHEEIVHSTRPSIPLIVSEFNATYMNEQAVTDSIFMGPWMADTIRRCDGLAAMMSYWTFSDVFEEQGVIKTPFYGGFGLMAEGGIPKPAFSAFALLHDLGTERLAASSDDVIVTRRKDGTIVIAAWNLLDPDKFAETKTGASKTIGFDLMHIPYVARATIRRVDAAHGDTLNAWKKMGSPQSPTQAQIVALRKASEIGPPEQRAIHGDTFSLTLPPMGLALIEIPAQRRAAAEPMH